MKALIFSFAGALVVGISVAGAASILRNPPVVAAAPAPVKRDSADSVRVIDSLDVKNAAAAHAAPAAASPAAPIAEGGHAAAPVPAPSADAAHDVKQQGAVATHTSATNAPLSPMPQSPAATPPAPTGTKANTAALPEQRIARVFANMAPKDAAKVLEQMSDPDIATILGNISEKQIALILAKLPAERVAALSKLGLRSHGAQP